ncbi:MAG: class I SAM-dependent methyltransferase [Clostridia bacterium]|nr:class I SAM-dependent methyltransferase [Clostridia bacterium]
MPITDHRLVFDSIPEQFDRWRVRYSPELFAHIVRTCGLGPGKRCLEIGPGTGQATDFALDAGCDYLAIELGAHLAERMREKYASRPNFRIVNADFETWPFEGERFDLIYSAAAIQWIREEVAYRRCFELLEPGGWLAMFLLSGNYRDSDPDLYADIQRVYDACFVSDQPYRQKFDYMNGTAYGLEFAEKAVFAGRREYTADEYLQYLGTHSDHITLNERHRKPFFDGIREAILRHGGRVVFDDSYILYLYRKPAATD